MTPDTFAPVADAHSPAQPLVVHDPDDYRTWRRTYRALFPVGLNPATAYREPRTRYHRAVRMEARRRNDAADRAALATLREGVAA